MGSGWYSKKLKTSIYHHDKYYLDLSRDSEDIGFKNFNLNLTFCNTDANVVVRAMCMYFCINRT